MIDFLYNMLAVGGWQMAIDLSEMSSLGIHLHLSIAHHFLLGAIESTATRQKLQIIFTLTV